MSTDRSEKISLSLYCSHCSINRAKLTIYNKLSKEKRRLQLAKLTYSKKRASILQHEKIQILAQNKNLALKKHAAN